MLVPMITLLAITAAMLVCALWGGIASLGWLWMLPVTFLCSFMALLLLATGFLWCACRFIDTDKPRGADSPFYRKLAAVYIHALIQLLQVRIHAEGLEKTPKEGRFLLVCNHIFVADPGILLHCFPHSQLAFISKKENRSLFVVGRIMHAMLCQCIDRENDRAALKTILECIRIIKEDQASVAVFPEGATHSDNHLYPFRPGAFKIAQKTKVPIVVCTLEGTRNIIRNGLRLKHTDVKLHLVDVIQPEEFGGLKTTEISDRVWQMMKNDLSEEYQPIQS